MLDENKFEEIRQLLPDTTYRYLEEHVFGKSNQGQIRKLDKIMDFGEYIDALCEDIYNINIFIVSKDAHTNSRNSNEIILKKLKRLGIGENLDKLYRWSFLAHIDCGTVKKCSISESDRLAYISEFSGNRVMLISEGYNVHNSNICDGKIIINRRQAAVDSRGLNIIVWDNRSNKQLDSVCFDTFKDARAIRRKQDRYVNM